MASNGDMSDHRRWSRDWQDRGASRKGLDMMVA